MALINLFYSDSFAMILAIVAAVPAAFVLYAFIRRRPLVTDGIRWMWKRGREFMLGSCVLNMFIVFVPVLLGITQRVSLIEWAQLGISIAIATYLYTDQRVKDVFADFPQPAESDEK